LAKSAKGFISRSIGGGFSGWYFVGLSCAIRYIPRMW
jgi:hypothetical protein